MAGRYTETVINPSGSARNVMKVKFDAGDDILCIKFSDEPIIREVSHGWHINLAFSTFGLCEITVLDAKKNGYWPIENLADLLARGTDDASADADARRGRADHGVFD